MFIKLGDQIWWSYISGGWVGWGPKAIPHIWRKPWNQSCVNHFGWDYPRDDLAFYIWHNFLWFWICISVKWQVQNDTCWNRLVGGLTKGKTLYDASHDLAPWWFVGGLTKRNILVVWCPFCSEMLWKPWDAHDNLASNVKLKKKSVNIILFNFCHLFNSTQILSNLLSVPVSKPQF